MGDRFRLEMNERNWSLVDTKGRYRAYEKVSDMLYMNKMTDCLAKFNDAVLADEVCRFLNDREKLKSGGRWSVDVVQVEPVLKGEGRGS